MTRRRVVLASASPRRRTLLEAAGVDLDVRPADVDEAQHPGEPPEELVVRLALAKARAVAVPGEVTLGADTVVVLDGAVLGKPAGAADARRMLARLSGRAHQVLTGVALVHPSGATTTFVDEAEVTFRELGHEEITSYVDGGEPLDKAGAYAIQGGAARFVVEVRGDRDTVVGLPVRRALEALSGGEPSAGPAS